MIQFNAVNYSYANSGFQLKNITFEAKEGEVVGLLGPNGAGKSTCIRLLLGLMKPLKGSIQVGYESLDDYRAKENVGYLPEVAQYYSYMTFTEALFFYGGLSGLGKTVLKERVPVLLEKLGAKNLADKFLNKMSKGQLQRLGLAQALIHEPKMLVLDEPMSGLDPLARAQIKVIIQEQKGQGKTILFSSHELSEIEAVCDRFVIMKAGAVIWQGTLADLRSESSGSLEQHFLEMLGSN